jgi:hypothetical protein
MTAERALHEHWSSYRPLAEMVPANRVYTGLPPIRDDAEMPLTFPYVSLTVRGESVVERTSQGNIITAEMLRFSTFSRDYDEARKVAQAIGDYFNRKDFPWSRGRVLDIRPTNRLEEQDAEDGVWTVARDFIVQTVDTTGAKT